VVLASLYERFRSSLCDSSSLDPMTLCLFLESGSDIIVSLSIPTSLCLSQASEALSNDRFPRLRRSGGRLVAHDTGAVITSSSFIDRT